MMHYELFQRPLGKDAQDAAKAFAYFNQCLNADATQADRIEDGRHPVSDLAFVKMGSLMAARLKERFGAARLASYHKRGVIPLFADYAAMSSSDPGYPKELRLVAVGKMEEAIAALKAGEELHPQASVFATSLKRISEKKAQRD